MNSSAFDSSCHNHRRLSRRIHSVGISYSHRQIYRRYMAIDKSWYHRWNKIRRYISSGKLFFFGAQILSVKPSATGFFMFPTNIVTKCGINDERKADECSSATHAGKHAKHLCTTHRPGQSGISFVGGIHGWHSLAYYSSCCPHLLDPWIIILFLLQYLRCDSEILITRDLMVWIFEAIRRRALASLIEREIFLKQKKNPCPVSLARERLKLSRASSVS